MVYRTVDKLPKIYEDEDGVIIKSVFSIDGSTDFMPIKVNEYMRKLENPLSKYDKSNYYFYNNGYLYFPKRHFKRVMVKALFEENLDNYCQNCPQTDFPCLSRQEHNVWMPDGVKGELMDYVLKDILASKQLIQDSQIDKNEGRKN